MKTTEELLALYNSKKGVCCKCGCTLEDNNGQLGSVFVLDRAGNFYCTNCDGEFEDGDENIFEAEFYEHDGFVESSYVVSAVGYAKDNTVTDFEKTFGTLRNEEVARILFNGLISKAVCDKSKFFEDVPEDVAYLTIQIELCDFYTDCVQAVEVLDSFDTFAPAKEPSPPLTLNVGFINSEDRQDETQLDVDASSFEATLVDFANLLFSLRNEMGIKEITYVNKEDGAYDC